MSTDTTAMQELLTWLGENRTKIENEGFWYVDVGCKIASMLSQEKKQIEKAYEQGMNDGEYPAMPKMGEIYYENTYPQKS